MVGNRKNNPELSMVRQNEFLCIHRSDIVKESIKKTVLFVGSFNFGGKAGHIGGQMFACTTLINSQLSEYIDWLLIDSTADNVISSGFIKRLGKATFRIVLFVKHLLFTKIDYCLIFSSNGFSFWEKGFMVLLTKWHGKAKIIFAPRTGAIIDEANKKRLMRSYIRFVLSKCDFVICQSLVFENSYRNLVNDNFSNKFVVIENWIDTTPYESLNIKQYHEKPVRILFLSWIERFKGIIELINAAKMLQDDEIEFQLVIAGGGSSFNEVVQLIKLLGLNERVDLVGWVFGDEKLQLIESSDIYVLPSYNEGYPNSLMEAMAAGKACIATRVGAIPDMIIDGKTGLLIESKNTKELYDKMKMLILNAKMQIDIGEGARKKILSDNTIATTVSKFNILFS